VLLRPGPSTRVLVLLLEAMRAWVVAGGGCGSSTSADGSPIPIPIATPTPKESFTPLQGAGFIWDMDPG
jgi:hypothetical protein